MMAAGSGHRSGGAADPYVSGHWKVERCASSCIWRMAVLAASDATGVRDASLPLSQVDRNGTAASRFQGVAWWSEGGSNP